MIFFEEKLIADSSEDQLLKKIKTRGIYKTYPIKEIIEEKLYINILIFASCMCNAEALDEPSEYPMLDGKRQTNIDAVWIQKLSTRIIIASFLFTKTW